MLAGSPLAFSHGNHGANVRLSMDGVTAWREGGYNRGIVVSAAPLEDNYHYQVMVKRLSEKRYNKCMRIGVTSLPLETVCSWERWRVRNDSSGNTTVLDSTDDSRLCICTKGQRYVIEGSHMDLSSLREGESLGVICTSSNELMFTINGLEIRSLTAPLPLPSPILPPPPRFLFVDVYGPVIAVESLPIEIRGHERLRVTRLSMELVEREGRCQYFDLCRRFLLAQRATITDVYFSWEHSKCYCDRCYNSTVLPKVKKKGSPPQEYTVPIGWVKFGLCCPKRAEVLDIFRDWHVCYHGTPVERVADILDCGQLMIRGDRTLPGRTAVPSPSNHFNKYFRPEGYDLQQIFLSPSLHYCTYGEVYAGGIKCVESESGKVYTGKVAFQLRVHPQAYTISQQTTQSSNLTSIDPLIPNDRIEWSTKYRNSTILTSLCIKLTSDS